MLLLMKMLGAAPPWAVVAAAVVAVPAASRPPTAGSEAPPWAVVAALTVVALLLWLLLNPPTAGSGTGRGEDIGEARLVADDVQQQVNGDLTLPLITAALPKHHPSMGTLQVLGVLVPAVTNRQVEPQDRGQLDVVHALVILFRGHRVHLAIQREPIEVTLVGND